MIVRVQYTAQLRAAVGRDEEELELRPGENLADLLVRLATDMHREAAPYVLSAGGSLQPSLLIGLNARGVLPRDAQSVQLQAGDVVTLMPPIAGG